MYIFKLTKYSEIKAQYIVIVYVVQYYILYIFVIFIFTLNSYCVILLVDIVQDKNDKQDKHFSSVLCTVSLIIGIQIRAL